jgi:hypothetical protein
MHARDLLELAAILSSHGPLLVEHSAALPEESLQQYWSASKCRLDRWGRRLKQIQRATPDREESAISGRRNDPAALLEEILTGEVLTRVWSAIVAGHDRRHRSDQAEPIARSVLIGHLEARWRVLCLLTSTSRISVPEAMRLDRLRNRSERWADLLLGYLSGVCNASEFAIDPARMEDFSQDLHGQVGLRGGHQTWNLVQASLRAAFGQGLAPSSPNADLNAQIAAGILSSFPPELFHGTGLLCSLWTLRLYQTTNEAQGMLDQLLALDSPPKPAGEDRSSRRPTERYRRFGRS